VKANEQCLSHWFVVLAILVPGLIGLSPGSVFSQSQENIKRGEYIFRATGGCSCHTVPGSTDQKLAGGRGFKTPFGTLFSTNITPHKVDGIGSWTISDFAAAMRKGVRSDGAHLFPVFPYTSFTRMSDRDLSDLWAYLSTYPAVEKQNKPIDMPLPFRWRIGMLFWKFFYFSEGAFKSDPAQSSSWNRGAYITTGLAHCHECHTPRDLGGGLKKNRLFTGSIDGPEGELAPNITPDKQTGIGNWTRQDLSWFMANGLKPDGDSIQGLMAEVIEEGYQYLSPDDLDAVAEYILSLEPMVSSVATQR